MSAPEVRYFPHVVSDADRLFEQLADEIAWSDQMRARRTASFGLPYNYSGQTYEAVPMPPRIAAVADVAAALAGHRFDNCLANLYESGRQRMGFHRDGYEHLEPTSSIAIASLGATRALVFRSLDLQHRVAYPLEHGSILLCARSVQDAWTHGVPEADSAGRRISLAFRRFAVRSR
jgi:alkylated DNA repair dioxygenase AlkB